MSDIIRDKHKMSDVTRDDKHKMSNIIRDKHKMSDITEKHRMSDINKTSTR